MNKTVLILLIIITGSALYSQSEAVPDGFRSIKLGTSLEEAKLLIENDGYFDYRGDEDLSMLLTEDQSLIECGGKFYIKEGFFQFKSDKLFTITLILDPEKVDYFTIFNRLQTKYGKYTSLSPKLVVWEFGDYTLHLEKPLTIKYIDQLVIEGIIQEDTTDEALEKRLRENFLDEL